MSGMTPCSLGASVPLGGPVGPWPPWQTSNRCKLNLIMAKFHDPFLTPATWQSLEDSFPCAGTHICVLQGLQKQETLAISGRDLSPLQFPLAMPWIRTVEAEDAVAGVC